MNLRDAAAEHEQGLITEPQRFLNQLLREYDPYLSLWRIPESDPAFAAGMQFDPPRVFGIREETSAAETKWVFTIPEISIQNPAAIIARVAAGDMTKFDPAKKMQLLQDSARAVELAKQKRYEEQLAERREEMLFIASTGKSSIRHKMNGEDLILGDEVRRVRSHI